MRSIIVLVAALTGTAEASPAVHWISESDDGRHTFVLLNPVDPEVMTGGKHGPWQSVYDHTWIAPAPPPPTPIEITLLGSEVTRVFVRDLVYLGGSKSWAYLAARIPITRRSGYAVVGNHKGLAWQQLRSELLAGDALKAWTRRYGEQISPHIATHRNLELISFHNRTRKRYETQLRIAGGPPRVMCGIAVGVLVADGVRYLVSSPSHLRCREWPDDRRLGAVPF